MDKKLLLTLFAGVLIGALDIAILAPVLPVLREELAIDPAQGSWLVTAYVLGTLAGTPILAALSDIRGRAVAFRTALGLFGVASILVALAPTFLTVAAARLIQGFGAGGIFPVAAATIGDAAAPEKRGRFLGLIGATFGLAFLVGPLLGSTLLHWLPWRALFLLNLPLVAAILWNARRGFPVRPSIPRPEGIPDIAGLLLLPASLALLALGLTRLAPSAPWFGLLTPGCGGLLGAGLLAGAGLVAIERHASRPVLNPRLFQRRDLRLALLLALGAGLGEVGVLYLPSLASERLAMTRDAGFLLTPLVIALTLGAPLAGRLLDRSGARPVLLVGTILQMLGFLVFARLPTTRGLFLWAGPLLGLGLACLLGAPLRVLMLRSTPENERTASQSLLSNAISVGQIASAALLGAVAAGSGHGRAYAVGGVLAALLIVPAALVTREPA